MSATGMVLVDAMRWVQADRTARSGCWRQAVGTACSREDNVKLTLNPYMDVILRLLGLAGILVGFGEGVC